MRSRRSWHAPAAQLVVLAAVVLSDVAIIDARAASRAADLAADRGVGPAVTVQRRPPRQAKPVAISIPRLQLSERLVNLGLRKDRTLEVPSDPAAPGWYTGSAHPGDPGATVVVGHVDSQEGPAVFHGLRRLRPGDRVVLRRADRSTATFAVDEVRRVAKRSFPTAEVYSSRAPVLRLVTCGGVFDRRSGHYLDNVIVFARLVSAKPPREGA